MTLRMPGVQYLGPPDSNWSDGEQRPPMGQVTHIAEGSFVGTINWQRNPAADVSSFFVVSLSGEIVQMLDLDLVAWTQANGNPAWVGVENEGWHTGQLTPAQVEANARIFAWLVSLYPSIPYTVTNSPGARGLGWHGMGGSAWGNHPDCPGPANVALLPTIVARAQQINGGAPVSPVPARKRGKRVVPYIVQDKAAIVLAWADTTSGKWVYANIIPPGDVNVSVPQLVNELIAAGCVGYNGGTIGIGESLAAAGYVPFSSVPGLVPPVQLGEVVVKMPELAGTLQLAPVEG